MFCSTKYFHSNSRLQGHLARNRVDGRHDLLHEDALADAECALDLVAVLPRVVLALCQSSVEVAPQLEVGSGWLRMTRDGSGWLGTHRDRSGASGWIEIARDQGRSTELAECGCDS